MTEHIASIINQAARNLVTEDSLQKTCEKGSIHCQLPGHITKEAQSVQLPEPEMVISEMYESPIKIYHRRMSQKIEDDIIKAVQEVCVEVGISVDKEELIKALQYDRDQYAKGYKDGMNLRYGDDFVPRAEVDELVHKLECLLCHATGGKLSYHTYPLGTMERAVNDYIHECCDEAYNEAKVEVAREIFEEIEGALEYAYDSDCQSDYPIPYYHEYLKDDIAELKKKYTENP